MEQWVLQKEFFMLVYKTLNNNHKFSELIIWSSSILVMNVKKKY